jgi:hypothetical protein
METTDVLLIRSLRPVDKGHNIRFLDETELFVPGECYDRGLKREIASRLLMNTLRVAEDMAPVADSGVKWLKNYVYTGVGDYDESPFRIAIVGG